MNVFLAICFSPALIAALVIFSMYLTESAKGE
jgi:hypothetical protein